MMAEEKNSVISHFLVIGGGTAINLLVGVLTTPFITRIVDPAQYGQWSIFTMYASIGLMIFCLGLDQSMVRFFYRKDDYLYRKQLVFICWSIPVFCTVIAGVIISFCAIQGWLPIEFEPMITVLLCVHVLILIFNRFGQLVLRVSYNSKLYSLTTIIQKIVYVVCVLIPAFILKKEYFLIMVIATMISYSVPALVSIISQRKLWSIPHKSSRCNDFNSKELIMYGMPFILSLGITTIFQSIDKLFLNFYCTYIEVGIYSSAMTLVHIFAILQTTFNALWTPLATENYEKNPDAKKFFQKGNQIITVLMFVLGVSLILIKDVFALLLGEEYREAAFILPFLIFNPIMYTISESTCMGIGFAKKTKLNIVVAVTACAINIVGNAILIPIFGGRGAAISTGISYIVFWALRTVISNRYYYIDYKIKKFIVMTLVVVAYAAYNTFNSINSICIVGYVCCIGLIFMLYKSTILDLVKIVRTMILEKYSKRRSKA